MAAPSPQEQKVSALQKALGATRQSQADAKAAAQVVKSPPSAPTPPGGSK